MLSKSPQETAQHHFQAAKPETPGPTTFPAWLDTTPLRELRGRAKAAGVGNGLLAIMQLSRPDLCRVDPGVFSQLVGAHLGFLSSPEVISTLARWSNTGETATALLDLAEAVAGWPDLLRTLVPFGPDQRVKARLAGYLEAYSAALCACRRPVIRPNTLANAQIVEGWIQRLRVLLLLRSIEALDYGVVHDERMRRVQNGVRLLCDEADDVRLDLLAALAAPTPSPVLDTPQLFAAALRAATEVGSGVPAEGAARTRRARLLDLQHIAANDFWWDPKAEQPSHPAFHILDLASPKRAHKPAQTPLSFDLGSPTDPTPGVINLPSERGEESLGIVEDIGGPPGVRSPTPAQERSHGERLLLESLEARLHLPGSWHTVTNAERAAIESRVRELLRAGSPTDRLGAALVVVAVATGRSMYSVETLVLRSQPPFSDWALDLEGGRLRRQPPRMASRIKVEKTYPESAHWYAPRSDLWELALANQVLDALRQAAQTVSPENSTTVAGLWRRSSPNLTLDRWFDQQFVDANALSRLSSPSTATIVRGLASERTEGDIALAELVGANARSGLSARCAYSAYRADQVHTALVPAPLGNLYSIVAPRADQSINAAGSELDVDVQQIRASVQRVSANYRQAAADPMAWVDAHNHLMTWVVLGMLASTGGRPIRSPFEDLSLLDLDAALVLLRDKATGPTAGTRLCVVARAVCDTIKDLVLPHLHRVVALLGASCPTLAAELGSALDASPNPRAPFLYFLRVDDGLVDWVEISETTLVSIGGIDWPAPMNLLRHLNATLWRRAGLHPDIVDSLLGHGDRGAEAHGDHSPRVPRDDFDTARPVVEATVADLGFASLEAAIAMPEPSPQWREAPGRVERTFGHLARATAREHAQQASREQARTEIEAAIRALNKPPDALGAEEWDRIGRSMILRESGLPHSAAALRYEVYEQFLALVWRQTGKLPTLGRRMRPYAEPVALFEPRVVAAGRRLDVLRASLDRATPDGLGSALTQEAAALLGALHLVLHSQVAHRALVQDLVRMQDNVRLVRLGGQHWFEWAGAAQWLDGRPVVRIPVAPLASVWIAHALTARRRGRTRDPDWPRFIAPWATGHFGPGCTVSQVLQEIVALQGQQNALQLPGFIAAYLSGRNRMSALPHQDFVRLSMGEVLAVNEKGPPTDQEAADATTVVATSVAEIAGESTQESEVLTATASAARELADRIRRVVDRYGKGQHATDAQNQVGSPVGADGVVAEIRRLVRASPFVSGSGMQVLASYACHLLKRPPGAGTRSQRLRPTTVRRYWYVLAGPIVDLAHQTDLRSLDSDELTELYADILDWWDARVDAPIGTPGPDLPQGRVAEGDELVRSASALDQDLGLHTDARSRALQQLVDLHAYARGAFGLVDPDWSELGAGHAHASGRPGLILETELTRIVQALSSGGAIEAVPDERLSAAAAAVLCGRFGLRISEAIGLAREDWVEAGRSVVVLVRANALRGLKRPASRRQVPWVEEPTRNEETVMAEVLRRWDLSHRGDRRAPLLPGVTSTAFTAALSRTSDELMEVLKAVVGHSAATIHHLRHAYATRLLALSVGLGSFSELRATPAQSIHANRLLTATTRPVRRTLWSVARLLGHASPATTLQCYAHLPDLWFAQHSVLHAKTNRKMPTEGVLDLDAAPRAERVATPPTLRPRAARVESDLWRRFALLRLVSLGWPIERAAATTHLDCTQALALVQRISRIPFAVVDAVAGDTEQGAALAVLRAVGADRLGALGTTFGPRVQQGLPPATAAWAVGTIGARLQVLLYEKTHFAAFKEFADALGIGPADLALVPTRRLLPAVRSWIEEHGLGRYIVEMDHWPGKLQIDGATTGVLQLVVRHRVAVLRRESSNLLRSSRELAVLWAVTH